jgi:dienelactone hydrolase
MRAIVLLSLLSTVFCIAPLTAQETQAEPSMDFLRFIRNRAQNLRAQDQTPATREAWDQRQENLRHQLAVVWGEFPTEKCELAAQSFGELQRDGYRVERLIFQTRPGVWMTANAYVPEREGQVPAVLCVHGHWQGAKQDPVVQQRCIGLAKLGFFVLAVDAFGAGERGQGKALGEYHGEMTAAALLPVGLPLAGLQMYENVRAIDYLCERPEVDPKRIGVTGASGGGNQTMYVGAWDERLRAIVPVCSVGNYQAYLGAACCMCEVVPGALSFTEEGDILGLAATRGLMVISATRDAPQFSVAESQRSVARAQAIARLLGTPASVRHTIIESSHDYNRIMREAMYGWMTLHLKGEGDGSPIAEPDLQPEDPENLRCFPGESRPYDFMTIPRFAALEARRLLSLRAAPKDISNWRVEKQRQREVLENEVLGGNPPSEPLQVRDLKSGNPLRKRFQFVSEQGITLQAELEPANAPARRLAVLLSLDGTDTPETNDLVERLVQAGWRVLIPELRATGRLAFPRDKIGQAPDHNSAQWSLWIGRPLVGQWVWDVRRSLDAFRELHDELPQEIAIIGIGPAGVPALCAAAIDERFTHTATIDTLATFVTEETYRGQRLGILAPGIVRDIGDICHVAALISPRPVVVAGGVLGNGEPFTLTELERLYAPARKTFALEGAEASLRLVAREDAIKSIAP